MPKNDLIPLNALQAAQTADLRAELARGLTLTAEHLTRLGAIWAELERRGEDLSDLRAGLAEWLPKIAAGRLAAEAVVAFATKRLLLRAIEGVPLEQQRRLAAGEEVQVLAPGNPEGIASVPVTRLPPAAIRLVFQDGELRTPQQQRLALRPRQQRRRDDDPEDERHYRPRYDHAAGVVRVGKMAVPLAELLAELSAAASPEGLPAIIHKEEYLTVRVRLTTEEHARLLEHARQAELPEWEVCRKALRAFGLI
jgi:hypothetical protein